MQKNNCEETVFIIKGEQHEHKPLNILFLDKANNCHAQIAEAVARTNFPKSGNYNSAGISENGDDSKGAFCEFLEGKGYICGTARSKELKFDIHSAAAYDIIISLDGPVSDYFSEQPFRTTFLEWKLDSSSASNGNDEERYVTLYREMSAKVGELMETLRGSEAE